MQYGVPAVHAKKPIEFQQTYYACSVSTCNRTRHGFCFCSVSCWDAHVPMMRHREAWAEPQTAPTREAVEQAQQAEQAPPTTSRTPAVGAGTAGSAHEVLIVVSKLKQYIKQQAAMHTADTVHGVLSDHLRHLCDQAIAHATAEGRKTVMDRDFAPFVDLP
jgi:hypothetical protein